MSVYHFAVLAVLVAAGLYLESKGYGKPKRSPTDSQVPAHAAVSKSVAVVTGPRKTTYRQKYRTSHGGHAVGTVITGGLWAPMWAVFTVANKVHPGRKITERHHY